MKTVPFSLILLINLGKGPYFKKRTFFMHILEADAMYMHYKADSLIFYFICLKPFHLVGTFKINKCNSPFFKDY